MTEELKTQHVFDPRTGQKKTIKVRSIKSRFRKGKGGAIAFDLSEAVAQPAKQGGVLNAKKDD